MTKVDPPLAARIKALAPIKSGFLSFFSSGGLYLRFYGGGIAGKMILWFDQSMSWLKRSSQDKSKKIGVEGEWMIL